MTYSDKTILIVDDDMMLRSTLRKILHKRMGVTAVEAGDPMEAFEILKTLSPDAIILDIQMPYMNGLTVLENLRRIPATRDIPVLACTGMTHKNIVAGLLKMNINAIIAKPFNSDTVVEKLRLILEYSNGDNEVQNEISTVE